MWQLCSSIPSSLPDPKAVSLMTAKVGAAMENHGPTGCVHAGNNSLSLSFQLSTSFVLETFIHSKEKVKPSTFNQARGLCFHP